MFKRILIVLWGMALFLGVVFYFWDASVGQHSIADSVKLLATVLGILAAAGSVLKLLFDFEKDKKSVTNN